MPSWSTSDPPQDKLTAPSGTGLATAVDSSRRLLERLLASVLRNDEPRPKP